MKYEPTQLELYQAQRISALENALKEAQSDLKELSILADKKALKIRVNDPNYLNPISDMEFEIVEPCKHLHSMVNALGVTVCANPDCETPKYSMS